MEKHAGNGIQSFFGVSDDSEINTEYHQTCSLTSTLLADNKMQNTSNFRLGEFDLRRSNNSILYKTRTGSLSEE